MKIKYLILAISLLSSWLGAADIDLALKQLGASNHDDRLAARNALLFHCSKVTQPGELNADLQAQFEAAFWQEINSDSLPVDSRLYLLRMIEWFGSSRSVNTLMEFMSRPDERIADASRRALMSIDPKKLQSFVFEQLVSEQDINRQIALIDSLEYVEGQQILDQIFERLNSSSPEVRVASITACGRLGDRRAIEPLLVAYEALSASERTLAEHALIKIGMDADTAKFIFDCAVSESAKATAFKVLLQQNPELARSQLDAIIKYPHYPSRLFIFATILRSEDTDLKERLFNYLKDADQASQLVIVHLVGTLELMEQENLLLSLLESTQDHAIKRAIIKVLGQIGTDASYPAIYKEFLLNPKQAIYAEAIGNLNAANLDKKAISDARNGTMDEKIAAIKVLKLRNVLGATEVLNDLLVDVHSLENSLAREILSALEVLGDDASIQLLLNAICQKGPYLKLAQKSLYRLSSRYGAAQQQWDDYYYPLLSGGSGAACKGEIVEILASVACAGSLEYVLQILLDSNSAYKKNAMSSVMRWPDEPSLSVCFVWLRLIDSGLLSTQETSRAYSQLKKSLLKRNHEFSVAQGNLLVAIAQSSIPLETRRQLLAVYKNPKQHFYHVQFRNQVVKLLQPFSAHEQLGTQLQQLIDALTG